MEYVATPDPFKVPGPSVVAPSMKVTMPVGAGPPVTPATVAVKVTPDPTTIEDDEAVKAVVVDPAVTVTVRALELEARFLESPG